MESNSSDSEDEFLGDILIEEMASMEIKSDDNDDLQNRMWTDELLNVFIPTFTRKCGPDVTLNTPVTPLDCFTSLFTSEIIQLILTQTNAYAKLKKGPNEIWKELTTEELKVFLGLNMMMSVVILPQKHMYWSNDVTGQHWAREAMSRDRFDKIDQFLHLAKTESSQNKAKNPLTQQLNNTNDPYLFNLNESAPCLHKVNDYLSLLSASFKKRWLPNQKISVDEGMIAFQGRLDFKNFMKDKPVKWGIKVWKLCNACSGYLYAFEVYTGKKHYKYNGALGTHVVLSLLSNLPDKQTKPPWLVYTDNYYTSFNLLEKLYSLHIYLTGTIRLNRKGFPEKYKQRVKLLKQGEMIQIMCPPQVLLTSWVDRKLVTVLSSMTTPTIVVNSRPNAIHQHQKLLAAEERKEESQREFIPNVHAIMPKVIEDYSAHMRGVDKHDQYLSYYSNHRRNYKWWKCIFWHFFDAAVSNSYILYKHHSKLPETSVQLDRLSFITKLASQLLAAGNNSSSKKRKHHKMAQTSQHFVIESDPTVRRICVYCSTSSKITRTQFICEACNVHLCPITCFRDYHLNE